MKEDLKQRKKLSKEDPHTNLAAQKTPFFHSFDLSFRALSSQVEGATDRARDT